MQVTFRFDHVPVTFGAFFNEQLRNWETLFPAEQSYFQRLNELLAKTPPAFFDPLLAVEQKMGVTPRTWPAGRFTLEQVDFLNRNPHYAEWRQVITKLFAEIDPVLDAQTAAKGQPRVVLIVAPGELPVGPDRMWTRLGDKGKRIPLKPMEDVSQFAKALMGESSDTNLADACAVKRGPYSSWIVEVEQSFTATSSNPATVRLGYNSLQPYRARLMDEVQKITEAENIRGPRQLGERLKSLKPKAGEGQYVTDAVLSEFIRATLLSGNGTLLVNNTFAEWASIQAIRRARPHLLAIGFGIRNKVKPFSSLLIFSDQDKTTAIPTQADMLGSYIDLEMFYLYVLQEAQKYPEYRNNTAYLFLAAGMDEMLLIAPPDFPSLSGKEPLGMDSIHSAVKEWMRL